MKASYALGLFFIVSVSIIWSAASILVQYLYQGLDFDSPFLLTYIGTSLLTVLIPIFILTNEESGLHQLLNYCCCFAIQTDTRQEDEGTAQTDNSLGNVETISHSRPPPSSSFMKLSSSSTEGTPLSVHADSDYSNNNSQSKGQQQDETFNYDKDEEITSSPERSQRQPLNQHDNDGDEFINNDDSIDNEGGDHYYYDYYQSNLLSHRDHIEMAMKVAPFWFISNYFYNLSLQYTTIT